MVHVAVWHMGLKAGMWDYMGPLGKEILVPKAHASSPLRGNATIWTSQISVITQKGKMAVVRSRA